MDGTDRIANDVETIEFTDSRYTFADLYNLPPANTVPVANGDAATVVENVVHDIAVLGNDSDADGDTLSITHIDAQPVSVSTVVTLSSGATVELLANGSLRFDQNGVYESLNAGQTAPESFSYTISDGNGGTDTANVALTIQGVGSSTSGPGIVDGTAGDDVISTSYVDGDGDSVQDDALINDLVYGNAGNDTIHLGRGNDTAYGGAGNDVIYGGNHSNTIYGNAGNDTLHTGKNSSTLDGGDGNDILQALLSKGGDHTLTGGSGIDTFDFIYNDSTKSSDVHITDFSVGEDILMFDSVIFAPTNPANLPSGYSLSTASDGSMVINFDGSDTITLDGVTQAEFWLG